MQAGKQHWGTIIVGGGQAGLSAGYHLQQIGEEFLILDASVRIGDSWRSRWDSLKLFSPPPYNKLPGWSYPSDHQGPLTKDEMADYLEAYAGKFELPVIGGVSVSRLFQTSFGYMLDTSIGGFTADRVIVATGSNQTPHIPAFAAELSARVVQIHSSEYKNPESLPSGDVLVIGGATSGIEIAMELAKTRHTTLAGMPTAIIPRGVSHFAPKLHWWIMNNILTVRTPVGRKIKAGFIKGGAVFPTLAEAVKKAKLIRVPKVVSVINQKLMLQDERLVTAAVIIWCTGYRPDFSWIDLAVTDEKGWPVTERGVSSFEGLYFVGMPFQFGLTSSLVGGVGRDAAYIAKQIQRSRRARIRSPQNR